jgi:beta-site APP-cleaving enzyme 1 (memapsin 2)
LLPVELSPVLRVPLKHSISTSVNSVLENVPAVARRSDVYKADNNLHGMPGQGYYIEVAIGEPPQMINVLIDTGSSNFAVAAAPHFSIDTFFNVSCSQTLKNLGTTVNVPYTQGSWSGFLGSDIVRLVSMPNISRVQANIAFIRESTNFFINGSNWQGILGLAYSELARPDASVKPFFDSLTAQAQIANIFSLQLCGQTFNTSDIMAGTLVFGGVDHSLYVGDLAYVPLRREWYYEVVIVDLAVDAISLGLDCKEYNFDKTIVDSGTTNLRLPTRVYSALLAALKLQTTTVVIPDSFWQGSDLLCWPQGYMPWHKFPMLTIALAASSNETVNLVVAPQQYLRRISDSEQADGGFVTRPDMDCFRLSMAPSETGTVIGAVIMEGYYTVFDRENRRLGFGQTSCTDNSAVAARVSHVTRSHHSGDMTDCAYVRAVEQQSTLNVVSYVMMSVCAISLVIAAVVLFHRSVFQQFCWPAATDGIDNLIQE